MICEICGLRMYQCERCGGTGIQQEGEYWDSNKKSYKFYCKQSCLICGGNGKLLHTEEYHKLNELRPKVIPQNG